MSDNGSTSFQTVQLRDGETLFRQNDAADFAYAIESGRIDILLDRPTGQVHVATLEAGEIVGEMAIIGTSGRTATARARGDCVLQRITPDQFLRRLETMDTVMRVMVSTMLERLSNTLEQVESVSAATNRSSSRTKVDNSHAIACLKLENEIEAAIRHRQFFLHYQPIVALETRKIAGFEGLMRWDHPFHGMLGPDRFIDAAEECRLLPQMTRNSVKEACAALTELRIASLHNTAGVQVPFMSVNVSATDLDDPALVDHIRRCLRETGLPAEALRIEITESSLMSDVGRATAVLEEIRAIGIGVAVDDFGTGYSSLSHLARLPISTLKIDRSFVAAMRDSIPDRKMVDMIVGLGNDLEIPVIAEGIETEEQCDMLSERGCPKGQGFLFARPLPLDACCELVRSWDAQPFEDNAAIQSVGNGA